MKRTKIFFILAAMVLTGCNTIDDAADGNSGRAVVLTASSGDTPSVYGSMRSVDGLYESTTGFDGGEQVQLYLYNSVSPTNIVSGTYDVGTPGAAHKSVLTYSSGTELLYPLDAANSGTPAFTIYGIYPASSATSHTVEYNQTNTPYGNAMYKASDLMYASGSLTWTSSDDKDNARNLVFNHQLCKLNLTVVKGTGVHELNQVRMVGVKRKVTVSPSFTAIGLGTAQTVSDAYGDEIQLFLGSEVSDSEETYQYCCIFPPQTWSDAAFIAIDADGGTATFLTTKTFVAGREYSLTITLGNVESNFTATIDNWPAGETLPEDTFIY